MSRARSDIEKKTLNFREGDWDYLTSIGRPQGIPTSEIIRLLVSNFVDKKRREEKPYDFNSLDMDVT